MLKDILEILENNATTPREQIAVMTGESVDEVNRLIKEAEEKRLIMKSKAVINWNNIEDGQVLALIEVKISPQPDAGYDTIAEHIFRYPQVRSAYLVSGTSDLDVFVTGRNMREVAEFVSQKIAPVQGVHETVTHIMLKRYKEDGEVMQVAEEIKRQPLIF
jgi:DNA-binding Lrp family transcriptional regulator